MWWLGPGPSTLVERFLCLLLDSAMAKGIRIWLYGGFALDIHMGRRLREHGDVDFITHLEDWPRLSAALGGVPHGVLVPAHSGDHLQI